jgi:dienelactone hydrolase
MLSLASMARSAFIVVCLAVAACGNGAQTSPDVQQTDAAGDSDAGAAPAGAMRVDILFSTSDAKSLTGYLTTGSASPSGAPGVILIHQYQQNDEQWGDLPEAMANAGYRVLAFNLRGHGDSDGYDGSLPGILDDPVAALDVDAALDYLKNDGQADAERIAIVGTSIGANLAVAAAIRDIAKSYVSFSSRKSKAEKYAGSPARVLSSVYYVASENDGGNQAADAQTLHELTTKPRAITIYPGTADHGIAILKKQSDAQGLLMEWLARTL